MVATLPITVTLRPEKRGTFFAHHPWVLAKSLVPVRESVPPGSVIDLVLPDGRWVARGLYNGDSRIPVRLYTWNQEEELDDAFWSRRLELALGLREQAGLTDRDGAARWVFSEADGLSGLIVDHYAGHLVVQFTARVMQLRAPWLLDWLEARCQPLSIQVRIDPHVARAEHMELVSGFMRGVELTQPVEISEHGVRLQVDLCGGQKTGYYLDQRENRVRAASYLRGRSVLDVCCYAGGFALAAARAGASEVLAIDASAKAIDVARHHAMLNGFPQIQCETGDCFDTLERLGRESRRFGGVILDPPRFAGSRHHTRAALQAYHRLNRLAMQVLEPGGILVTCSCSGVVSREDFRQMLVGASQRARRELQLLEQRGAGPDHPVRVSCPETEYLKCIIARVL